MASSRLYMPVIGAARRQGLSRTAQIASRLPTNIRARNYNSQRESDKKFVIWRPWLRLSIGIPFIGALIYSMVTENVAQTEAPTIAEIDRALKEKSPINDDSPMRLRMEKLIKEYQKKITEELSRIDGKSFKADEWTRPNGGGGISCVLQDGNVFEKAGVNVSVVYGQLPRPAIEKMRADHKSFVGANVDSLSFFAAGLSLVLHPRNPNAPTVHMNYRYFETSDPKDPINGDRNWWFGGGTDLTPSYLYPEDCKHFHQTIKDACDKHDSTYYPRFKAWCDKYFYIPHRGEARGVGGIFFDDLDANFLQDTESSSQNPQETLFAFVSDALDSFLPSYVPILERRKDMPFTEKQKQWQQLRRGRYVEFNLVYDRGTSFGLRTPNARVESILMSLPRTASWAYMDPVSGTRTESAKFDEAVTSGVGEEAEEEARQREMLEVLKQPRQWA